MHMLCVANSWTLPSYVSWVSATYFHFCQLWFLHSVLVSSMRHHEGNCFRCASRFCIASSPILSARAYLVFTRDLKAERDDETGIDLGWELFDIALLQATIDDSGVRFWSYHFQINAIFAVVDATVYCWRDFISLEDFYAIRNFFRGLGPFTLLQSNMWNICCTLLGVEFL